jgi:3-methyladenine DNA glycosylase AlkD
MSELKSLRAEIRALANPEKARVFQRFFKTGKGEYAEGDVFIGLTVPQSRAIAKKYLFLSLPEIKSLLDSDVHEERFIALIVLASQFKKSKKDRSARRRIVEFYLKNTSRINNWDLVDSSADKILGEFLNEDDKSVLHFLAKSQNLWERRIAIIATLAFIRKKRFGDTLAIAEMLLRDDHDLIHKAVGWMLREVGKRDRSVLEIFLKSHYKDMPRTMLRYSIEKFEPEVRQAYIKGKI